LLGNILKKLRKNAKLSQQQLADILGIDRSTYSYYELNKSNPPIAMLIKIAKIFGITVDELIGNQAQLRLRDDSSSLNKTDNKAAEKLLTEKIVRLSDLSDDEKLLVIKYRLLEDKSSIKKFFE